MTIMEALEKTKRMRDEKARRDLVESRVSVRMPAVVRKAPQAADLPPAAPVTVDQLPIDTAVCAENRILLSSEKGSDYSAIVDSYRILRTRLASRASGMDVASSYGVVSAGPGEGKTVTSLNLALAFAREKKRNVFLLDLDLRNPSVCRYLGVIPKVGIGDVLLRQAKPEDAFFGIGIDNLILAGGLTSHENSSELLGGPGMNDLFDHIHHVDPNALILVDLPPLLLSADALVVTPRLSAVVLVVAEGITRREQLARTVDVLSGTTVAGMVLNRSRETVEDYYG